MFSFPPPPPSSVTRSPLPSFALLLPFFPLFFLLPSAVSLSLLIPSTDYRFARRYRRYLNESRNESRRWEERSRGKGGVEGVGEERGEDGMGGGKGRCGEGEGLRG